MYDIKQLRNQTCHACVSQSLFVSEWYNEQSQHADTHVNSARPQRITVTLRTTLINLNLT
jgi:hypothetical protein